MIIKCIWLRYLACYIFFLVALTVDRVVLGVERPLQLTPSVINVLSGIDGVGVIERMVPSSLLKETH